MDSAKIIEHVMQRYGMGVIVDLLAVSIREPREAPHVHPHG
jgi:hypothetical protein